MAQTAPPRRRPRSLSATALRTYLRCPRQFGFQYLDAPPLELPTPGLVYGNAVHAALATFMRLPLAERDETAAHQALRHHWARAGRVGAFLGRDEEAAWGRDALELLSRFCRCQPLDVRPLAVEEWVRAKLPNGRSVCGRVDRVDRAPGGGLIVLDYKTGACRLADDEVGEDVGARLYALAASRTFHQPVLEVRFLYLREQVTRRWYPDGEDILAVEDELCELADEVASDRALLPQIGSHCHHCPFRERCPARDDARLDELEPTSELPF